MNAYAGKQHERTRNQPVCANEIEQIQKLLARMLKYDAHFSHYPDSAEGHKALTDEDRIKMNVSLRIAAKFGLYEILGRLLIYKADIFSTDIRGGTALHFAASDMYDVVGIEKIFNVNASYAQTVDYLVDFNTDIIPCRNYEGNSALGYLLCRTTARLSSRDIIIQALREKDAPYLRAVLDEPVVLANYSGEKLRAEFLQRMEGRIRKLENGERIFEQTVRE